MMLSVTLRRDGARVVLAGGIVGLAEERADVGRLLAQEPYDAVLLGVPFEDLDAIRATAGQERTRTFERDETDDLYFAALARYGEVEVPPGDLYAAYDFAQKHGLPVEAIDLGDEGHSALWAEHVGMFELIKNNRRLKRLHTETFEAKDAQAFAREWDAKLFPTKGLRRVQDEREAWMAKRIQDLSAPAKRLFVLVPLARWAGTRQRLVAEGRFEVVS
jgi:hypothetical protein